MVIMSTAISATARKSFRCTSLVATSNSWARQHIAWKIKPLATMSIKLSASSLILNQSFPNPYNTSLLGAPFTRQGTSNWQLKHKSLRVSQIRSIQHVGGSNHPKVDTISKYFPKFSVKGDSHEITNRHCYKPLEKEGGIMYADIAYGEGEKCIEKADKIVIWYTGYDEKKNCVSKQKQAKVPSDKVPTACERKGACNL